MDCILYKTDDLTRKSMLIDKALKKESKKGKVYRLLIIGHSSTGKSTLLKLIKILYGSGYTEQQIKEYKTEIYTNIWESIIGLLKKYKTSKEAFETWDKKDEAERLLSLTENKINFSQENLDTLIMIWKDTKFQDYIRETELTLEKSSQFFLDSLDRILQSDYTPTDADILRSHSKTTTPSEMLFEADNLKYSATDVGEMHGNLLKWLHVFDNINGIIFCVSLSDYAPKVNDKNKIREAMKLMKILCENPFFCKKDIHLVFNKKDVFASMLEDIPFSAYFPEYTGPNTEEDACDFIRETFCKLHTKVNMTYFTNALDIDSFRGIFQNMLKSCKSNTDKTVKDKESKQKDKEKDNKEDLQNDKNEDGT